MLTEISRDDFLADFFEYRPGEHLVLVSPTGAGKSHFMWQMLEQAMDQQPHLNVVDFMPKPADHTTDAWAKQLGLREIPSWPPRKKIFEQTPRGYVLWPPHAKNLDPEARRELVGAQLRRGLDSQFWGGDSISLVDDAHSAATMMHLNSNIEEHLVNGRANNSGIWLATQKPSGTLVSGGLTTFAWSSTSHLFLGKTPNESDMERYSEIGGVDPRVVKNAVANLRTYNIGGNTVTEWLYISKRGPSAALIGP